MEIIDYENNIINFNGKVFPFKLIVEELDGDDIEHIVSILDLQSELFDDDDNYVSDEAQWLDEQITYFVETEDDLNREDILEEIYG